ncbi:hypothetical protein SAMN05216231_2731 [Virgibacillus salinus]|uniref:Uncharacterized protein n=1 Tax=Virgibacillus salinus TaxID=553311 RepID=A0A1H1E5X5_9BACI|nr:hypothetical protein SAMN05216231_2731 [Virgibacillus salinus]
MHVNYMARKLITIVQQCGLNSSEKSGNRATAATTQAKNREIERQRPQLERQTGNSSDNGHNSSEKSGTRVTAASSRATNRKLERQNLYIHLNLTPSPRPIFLHNSMLINFKKFSRLRKIWCRANYHVEHIINAMRCC